MRFVWICLIYSKLFRVFGASPGSEEASPLEASKTPRLQTGMFLHWDVDDAIKLRLYWMLVLCI